MASIIEIKCEEGLSYLSTIENNSIDLILTDPPYIISRESGMNTHYNQVKANEENKVEFVKTEKEWNLYKTENNITDDNNKEKYMKYGTIYGKKYCVKTDYGEWDSHFTMELLETFIKEYYNKLRNGGTLILFFDLWKISHLHEMLERNKFKQIRFIEWIKTNPQPLNSAVNYLTNCREIALVAIKGSKPTFNSKYDNGIYMFPLQGGKARFHPTQKSLLLFEDLIKKHSNENDTVLDTFLGGGTTAIACKNTNRKFKGCEISQEYYDKINELI
jgi:site-specific DNA-methyltransferase (adenine-specific)